MNKIIYQDSNEGLLEQLNRRGETLWSLIETEYGVKSAASDCISKELLDKYRPDKHHALIHLIGMGDSRMFSFNKNGDWFDGDVLEKRAHTFVTHGHLFEEHRNKDPKFKKGVVKYAAYDPKMHRVEILVHLDKRLDPKGYEMAKQGKDLSFSMSCRVPNDRCSCCGNKAKTVAQYCDHLRKGMGKWDSGFNKYAFAFNDDPTFFDISKVANPADRIARYLEYIFGDGMAKAASHQYVSGEILIPSAIAAQAEGIALDSFGLDEQLVLTKLAAAEAYIADQSEMDQFYSNTRAHACYGAYPFAYMEKLASDELETLRKAQPETVFYEMAKRASVLSFPAFCQYITGDTNITEAPLFKKAALMLPSIFRDMQSSMFSMCPCTNLFGAGSKHSAAQDTGAGDMVQGFMNKMENKFSTESEPVRQRVMTIIIKSANDNTAAEKFEKAAALNVDPYQAMELAKTYGQYQIRALCDIRDLRGDDAVQDATYDLVAGANSVLVFDR